MIIGDKIIVYKTIRNNINWYKINWYKKNGK